MIIYLITLVVVHALILYYLDAKHDYHFLDYGNEKLTPAEHKEHGKKWHRLDTIIKICFNTIPIIVLACLLYFSPIDTQIILKWWEVALIASSLLIISVSIRWSWFDGWLYHWKKWGFFHVGTTALIDKIFSIYLPKLFKKGTWWYNNIKYSQFVCKFIMILISIILTIILINKFK